MTTSHTNTPDPSPSRATHAARIAAIALVIAIVGICMWVSAAAAADTAGLAQGRALAEQNCGRCHAVGPTGSSPLAKAPPFREIPARYPVENLAEALAEGIVTGHEEMPAFVFGPTDIRALLGYIDSLDPAAAGKNGKVGK